MFYACLSIAALMFIMVFCVTIAIIDLETYNFGLYIVLLCIVGTMLACALCIANPNACPNPTWYSNFCVMLQDMYPVPEGTSTADSKMTGLRSRLMAMQAQAATASTGLPNQNTPGATANPQGEDSTRLTLRTESRATVAMLAPAIHIMHQVWKGMAWVADGIDEEEEVTRSCDVEQGLSTSGSGSQLEPHMKRLSTIAESSIVQEVGDISRSNSEYNSISSSHDVMV
ncbi:hypothetical protein DdX_06377 [Ditylenchus destructor]|uniref:Uncharacterized protein n=1 Tax=Ditylenchus destructor TaxID=166010 RepID=A0AAD4N5U4_9BILA|nr:hypothetical protein DdX_06377 [Ditylenchus destructor]